MSTFESVSKKIGAVHAKTLKIAEEIYEAAKAAGHEVWWIWGVGTSADHKTKDALDLMVHNEAAGDFVRNYIWDNRGRLKLKHVIWEQHITSTVVAPGKRRKMEDRGDPTANHFDHVHALWFQGTYQAPERIEEPKDPGPGKRTPLVVDGQLGKKTILRWQQVMNNPTGETGVWSSNWVKYLQTFLRERVDHRLVVDGKWGPNSIRALQRYLKTPVDGVIDKDRSEVIVALQRRLNTDRF